MALLRGDAGGTRFVLAVYLLALGLGIALMPPTDGVAERHELLRGLATVGSGLLLLRAGAFPRRNTYLAEHVLAAVPLVWSAMVSYEGEAWASFATLVIICLTIFVLRSCHHRTRCAPGAVNRPRKCWRSRWAELRRCGASST